MDRRELIKSARLGYIISLLILLFLSACSSVDSHDIPYLERQSMLNDLDMYSDNLCPLLVKKDKPLQVATIYFNTLSSNSVNMNQLADDIKLVYDKCVQNIILISHVSTYESNKLGKVKALQLSFARANFVKNKLIQRKIDIKYIKIYSCTDSLNKFKESSGKAQLYNQSVDIIFDNQFSDNFMCVIGTNK